MRMFFALHDDVVIGGDVFIYYVEGNPRLTVAPDCFVVFDVGIDGMESLERNDTYLLWEVGKSPEFVLEIGSPSTWRNDLGSKRDLYASLGIGEYWMFDPSGGEHYGFALRGERLVDGEYRLLETREDTDVGIWGHSPTLNLEFHWEEGRLRLYDPVGDRRLPTTSELETARETAEARAELAEARVESAKARAESERSARESAVARMEELEAELRRLRGQE